MEGNQKKDYSLEDITNLIKSFVRYLFKRWWIFMLIISAGAGLGVIYYLMQKPKYEAVTTFILEEKSSSGGGLAGLASQFGLNIGSLSSGGSLFAGDNILDILRSKKVVQKVLLSPVDNTASSGKTLADLYLEFTGIKKKWQRKPGLADIGFANLQEQISPIQDSVLNVFYKAIIKKNLQTERFRKQSTIIKVQVTAENSLFARLMTERLVEEASRLYLDIKTGTAEANIVQMQRRSDSLLFLLNRKSYTMAASQTLDINPGVKVAGVPVEIAGRDKTVLATIYAEVTKNLEASKMLLSQQTPIIQRLDKPGILLDNQKKSCLFLVVVFSFGASLIYVFGAFVGFILSRLRAS